MPLRRGSAARTKAGISSNIRTERRAGKSKSQSVAIALSLAGKSRKKRGKK